MTRSRAVPDASPRDTIYLCPCRYMITQVWRRESCHLTCICFPFSLALLFFRSMSTRKKHLPCSLTYWTRPFIALRSFLDRFSPKPSWVFHWSPPSNISWIRSGGRPWPMWVILHAQGKKNPHEHTNQSVFSSKQL